MPDSLRSLIAETLAAHHTVIRDSAWQCDCGVWSEALGDEPAVAVIVKSRAAHDRHVADAIEAAIAAAGRLLPEGGQTREEWMVEIDKDDGWQRLTPYITTNRAPEPAYVADIDAYMRGIRYPKRKVHRTVHTGPWRPVESEETPAGGETP